MSMSTSTRALVCAGVAALLLPGASISEETRPSGYIIESYPGTIVTGGFGQCWHDSYWTAESRVDPCDPDAAVAQKSEPAAAPPAPAPEPPKAAQEAAPAAAPPMPAEDTTAIPLPAPVPQPEPATAQAAPQNPRLETALLPQTVHYSTDAFFDFDESTLRPEGRAALDDLVGQLGEVKYGSIRVVGHTDRIGGEEYNQALSERRANAVKNYLARRSVPANRIEAVGKGKSEPTVKTSACNGPKSPKVVACLQPDRRVDIEVAATKEATTGSR
jgi:OmpA-OmpF porin, OOP family